MRPGDRCRWHSRGRSVSAGISRRSDHPLAGRSLVPALLSACARCSRGCSRTLADRAGASMATPSSPGLPGLGRGMHHKLCHVIGGTFDLPCRDPPRSCCPCLPTMPAIAVRRQRRLRVAGVADAVQGPVCPDRGCRRAACVARPRHAGGRDRPCGRRGARTRTGIRGRSSATASERSLRRPGQVTSLT